jgi:alginate O-acetyltransferase complex protein AlgI
VPFRAPDLATTEAMLAGMVGVAGPGSAPEPKEWIVLAIALGLALLPWNNVKMVMRWWVPVPGLAVLASAVAFWLVLEVGRGQPASFIYFQF